jgi:hypothetical protein
MTDTKLERALAARLVEVEKKLLWLLLELKDREDVVDGSDGTPSPNEFMAILSDYERKFGRG